MPRLTSHVRIRQEVNKLLRQCGIHEPPIKVEAIAKSLGVVVRFEPFEDDISGVLYRDESSTIIGVSSLHHSNRQRFTIAHEIGHLILHEMEVHVDKGYRVVLRDSVSSKAVDPAEIDANRFAAELLMPASILRQDVRLYLHDIEDDAELRNLARKYRVSTQAMAYRLGNLGLFA
jgi:Zn-dependent peptidase ImmA (M78 family)